MSDDDRFISVPKLAVALRSGQAQSILSKEHEGLMHKQKLSNDETLTVTQQSYSEKEKEVFKKIAQMNDEKQIENLAWGDPSSKVQTEEIDPDIYRMFYQNTKMGSLTATERETVFKSLRSIFQENSDNPHLSNQMAKFINAKRNALDFKREFNIGDKPFTETSVGIANLGHGKKGGVKTAMESTLDSLDKEDGQTIKGENPNRTDTKSSAESQWTFPKKTEYKTAITSLVDSSLAGFQTGEAKMSQLTTDAAEKINKEYDAAVKRKAARAELQGNKGNKGFLGKKAKYEQVGQEDSKEQAEQDEKIIERGKVVVTRGAAYNTVAQSGNWSTGNKNAQAKALIELQNTHMDDLVKKMENPEEVRQDLRKLLANDMGLDDFKKKHKCEDMPDADLQKLALYAGRREVFEASKGFKKQFGAQTWFGKPSNNHIFHLAAATGMMKSMFGDHALEGCKSNKDRASMVRMMQMSMDRAMMQDPNWKLPKNPDQVTKAVSENPLVLMKEGGADEKDKDIKNMEALSERFRDLHYVDGKYDPYLSKVTAANAVGSEGALAHSETGVAGDSNNRAMMPAAFSAIYKVTHPDFLVRKQIDGFTADFNKGPKYEYVANAQKEAERVQAKFEAEETKFNERFKDLKDEEREKIKTAIEDNKSYKEVLEGVPGDKQKAVLDYRAAYLENKEWEKGMTRVKEAFLKSFEQLEITADKDVLEAKKVLTENRDKMSKDDQNELDSALFGDDKERPKKLRELLEKHGLGSSNEKIQTHSLDRKIESLLQRTGTLPLVTGERKRNSYEKNQRLNNLFKIAKKTNVLNQMVLHKDKNMSVVDAFQKTKTRSEAIDLLKKVIDEHALKTKDTKDAMTRRHSVSELRDRQNLEQGPSRNSM